MDNSKPSPVWKRRYPTDVDLARAAADGDTVAQQITAERLYDRIRTAVRYLSADHRDQDDWTHVVLVEILRSLGTFRGDASLESWANRIVLRKTMQLLRQSRTRDRMIVDREADQSLSASAEIQQTGVDPMRILMRRHLARLMGVLSTERRTAIVLRLVYGYSVDEIAEITAAPRNTVRQRLRRGRRQLRAAISKDALFDDWMEKINR
jgi:RNA polymerase sigma-70 factor (ECF subfamily)